MDPDFIGYKYMWTITCSKHQKNKNNHVITKKKEIFMNIHNLSRIIMIVKVYRNIMNIYNCHDITMNIEYS